MSGIVLLLAAGMIVLIVIWSIVNDRVGARERTTGLLAMRGSRSASERTDGPVDTDTASEKPRGGTGRPSNG